jgi:hypothetical protein
LAVNAAGGIMTSIALLIIIVAKFVEGAWVTLIIGPALIWLFWKTKHHYAWVGQQIGQKVKLKTSKLRPPIVVIPVAAWNRVAEHALRFGMEMSDEITVLHLTAEKEDIKSLRETWIEKVEEPARAAKSAVPELEIIESTGKFASRF